jgi:polar amino acid transport system substrate-binding protein
LRTSLFALITALAGLLGGCAATAPSADALAELAPGGTLRAAINFGNPILAYRDPATGEPRGVSVDLAREAGSAPGRTGGPGHVHLCGSGG